MALSDIAAGIEVTERQRDHGVAAVDDTDARLGDRLAPFADRLPCRPETAATVVEHYAAGNSVEASGHAAEIAPVTAAKTLHLLGEHVSPLGPRGREIVGDWLDGHLSRSDALSLTGVSERAFALAAYVETHDRIPAARDAVEGALSTSVDADPLGEARSDVGELL
jgi:hypothetical protein